MKEILDKLLTLLDKHLPKLLSGRYYLTLIGGIVFAYATWKRVLEPQAISAILTMVFISYFQRKREEGNQNKN